MNASSVSTVALPATPTAVFRIVCRVVCLSTISPSDSDDQHAVLSVEPEFMVEPGYVGAECSDLLFELMDPLSEAGRFGDR